MTVSEDRRQPSSFFSSASDLSSLIILAAAAVRSGRLTGTWDTDPVATGWAIIRLMGDYIGANRMSNPPRELVVRSDFWTSSNIARYVAPRSRQFTLDNLPLVN